MSLAQEILELKRSQRAVVLAHNYQSPEIQDLADYVGDSLGLSQQAAATDAEVIAFCGVHFMGETAKILCPQKIVVLPDAAAGCSLSDSCPADKLAAYLDEHRERNFYVVAYINCSAAVKALCDVICTSGNAQRIVSRIPRDREILFIPDRNLGSWILESDPTRLMTLWPGGCHVHERFTPAAIQRAAAQHPATKILVHPECDAAVRALGDIVCSTEKMIAYCRDSEAKEFILVTEPAMLHRMRSEVPGKTFFAAPTDDAPCSECEYMKYNTLEKLRDCLRDLSPQITLTEDLRARAETPVRRMLEWSQL